MSLGRLQMWNRFDRDFTNWLYGDYSEQKHQVFSVLYGLPGSRQYVDYKLDMRSDKEYMARYQLNWTDIHDPRKLKSAESTANVVRTGYNFVSKNVNRLYSNHEADLNSRRREAKRYRPRYRTRR